MRTWRRFGFTEGLPRVETGRPGFGDPVPWQQGERLPHCFSDLLVSESTTRVESLIRFAAFVVCTVPERK